MSRNTSSLILSLVALFCCTATLRAGLDSFNRLKLDQAKREWANERFQGHDMRSRSYDWQIEDALRRGEQGNNPFWKHDFDQLMDERRRVRENAAAIERARSDWEYERRRGSNNLTAPFDRRIRDTLDRAEYDDHGLWRGDFDHQMRQRRNIRRDSEFRRGSGFQGPIEHLTPPPRDPFEPFIEGGAELEWLF